MDSEIKNVFEIIKEYRSEEGIFMSEQIITDWICQFDENDRLFVLTELAHILKKRYVTKKNIEVFFRTTFLNDIKVYMKYLNFESDDVGTFLKKSSFINHQPDGKSQKAIIKIFSKVIQELFNLNFDDCGKESTPLSFIYLDDILCTGDTLYKGIAQSGAWIDMKDTGSSLTNLEKIKNGRIPIILVFYGVHELNFHKKRSQIATQRGKDLKIWYICQDDYSIDNCYSNNSSSRLEFLYPLEKNGDNFTTTCKEHIDSKVNTYCKENNFDIAKSYFYRPNNKPNRENFFSSEANRDKFEQIILKKSIEIYNRAILDSK